MQMLELVRSTRENRQNPGPLLIEVYRHRDLSPILLSNYRWAANDVSAMAAQSFRFRRAVVDLTNRQVHLLGLLLALRNGPHGAGETGLGDFAGRFLSEPPNKLIAELYGDCPPGTLGCLGKLPVRSVLGWRVYLDLLELLVEPRAAKVLLHATRITAKMIKDLKRVDRSNRSLHWLVENSKIAILPSGTDA